MGNSDDGVVRALSEFVSVTIAAPIQKAEGKRVAVPPAAARVRPSVLTKNPGDRPEASAGYDGWLPAYRMDRGSARVNAVESSMQAPRSRDYEDKVRTSAFLR